jgi:replicative DNA helicase
MLLYRPEYYPKYQTDENKGLAEVIIAKQRNGPTGLVRLQFFSNTMRFENRAPDLAEPISF